jgi:molybdopterin-guanine dinucleotide biosynthesis protein A
VDGDLVRRLLDRVGDAVASAPERAGGGVEATCAVYRVGVSPAVGAALASDDRSLHALFRDVGGVVLSLDELGAVAEDFLNVNTPADLERAEAVLASRTAPSA